MKLERKEPCENRAVSGACAIVPEAAGTLKTGSPEEALLRQMAMSGHQESAFLVCNVKEIEKKFAEWKTAFPFAQPYFGNYKFTQILKHVKFNFN